MLKEKLQFGWNQAAILEASCPVLDQAVRVLSDNKAFRLQVEGYASSDEGGDDHDRTLSDRRAATVLDCLVVRGIDKGRLFSRGFGQVLVNVT